MFNWVLGPLLKTKLKQKSTITKKQKVDNRILNLLQQDCRLSFAKIANKLNISIGTAFNHIKELENRGVIKHYSAILDPNKLGYDLTTIVLIQTIGGKSEELEEIFLNSPSVVAVYDITGDFDVAIITKFRNRNLLNGFIKDLLSKPHVRRTATNIALKVIKEDFKVELL
jgi:DNA-binding Lrp family transcriptional regulator